MTLFKGFPPPLGPQDAHIAAQLFIPERLTHARELRGLKKAELAKAIQKTPSAISQFETGRTRPDASTVASCALSLGVRLGFFTREGAAPMISTDDGHFRSLRSASQKERRQLLAHGALLCDLINILQNHVHFPKEEVTPVSIPIEAQGREDIERAAEKVRSTWGLGVGPIPNLVKLLESKGIIVVRIPSSCERVDAFSVWSNHRPLVFLVTTKGSPSRTRFDAAHELGHLVLHADAKSGNPDTENEANQFGSAFLMPRESFIRECPTTLNWSHLYELKRRWKAPVSAIVRRGFELGRLSHASYRRAFVHLGRTHQRVVETIDEPSLEPPVLIRKAMEFTSTKFPIEDLCQHMGIAEKDLDGLL